MITYWNKALEIIIDILNNMLDVVQQVWNLIQRLLEGINIILDTLIEVMPDVITYTSNMDVVLEAFALGTITLIITLWFIDRQ